MIGELLRILGFEFQLRRTGLANRLAHLTTLAFVAGSVGTAIGYALVNRARSAWDGAEDTDAPDHAG